MDIVSRADAEALGLKRYYTAEPCKNGHYSERYTNGGGCIDCLNAGTKRRMERIYSNPDELKQFREHARKKQLRLRSSPDYAERIRRRQRERWATDTEYRNKLRASHREYIRSSGYCYSETRRKWKEENYEKVLEYGRNQRRKNPQKSSMYTRIYHLRRRQAMPKWANKKHIEDMYATVYILNKLAGKQECGKTAFHVDHIIPLRGKNVCGLHVETNLQVLPSHENITKSNKFGG